MKIKSIKTAPKWWQSPKLIWELSATTLLFWIGLVVVHGNDILPNDIAVLFAGMWFTHFVTASVWSRRLFKTPPEERDPAS